MRAYTLSLVVLLAVSAAIAGNIDRELAAAVNWEEGGPGGGGGGGAGNEFGPGGNGGNGGGEGGGEGGQGGWGGPVSQGTDEECVEIARERCPTDGSEAPLLPDRYDCGAFCMCASGVGKYIACAGGLYFSETLQACTWPWEANCAFETK